MTKMPNGRKVVVLGSTGSIGTTFFDSLRKNNPGISVVAIAAYSNDEKLNKLKEEFNIDRAFLFKGKNKSDIDSFLKSVDADIVLNAISGSDGLYATLSSLESGKDVALANKESIVMGGSFLFDFAKANGKKIIPVDSEHSAIYNLKNQIRNVDSIILTASGGPFIDMVDFSKITLEDALKHPTWKMGKKITIDSATLANKGLEVIEASYLFSMPVEKIEVTIHRQSIVHSMIRTKEGAVYAQMSPPDMALPIIAAISDNTLELENIVKPLSFSQLTLTFESPDFNRFPMLFYAYKALESGASYPIAYNASNEIAVSAFIENKISFTQITNVVEAVLSNDFSNHPSCYDEIMMEDSRARDLAKEAICSLT